jgi:polyhydroxyalkanoate synthesis regulator phasin
MSSKLFGVLKSVKNVVEDVVPGAKAIDLAPKLENLGDIAGDLISNNPVAKALDAHPAIESIVDKVVDLAPIPESEKKLVESVLGVGEGQLSHEQAVVGKAVVEQKKAQDKSDTHIELLSSMAVSNQKQVNKLEDRIEELEEQLNQVIEHLNAT